MDRKTQSCHLVSFSQHDMCIEYSPNQNVGKLILSLCAEQEPRKSQCSVGGEEQG